MNEAFTVIDFETTGVVKNYPNEPWQIAMVTFRDGKLDLQDVFESLLRVGDRPFNLYAPGRHQQLREQILNAPSMSDIWPLMTPYLLNRPLVAHNAATEKKMLGSAFPMHRFGPWIDTLTLSRRLFPKLASHKLEDLIVTFKLKDQVDRICPGREAHDALYDTVGTGLLLQAMLRTPAYQGLSGRELSELKASMVRR